MKRHTEHVIVVVAVLVLIAIVLALFGYSGLYNIGADDHHWSLTYSAMQTVRDRSIHVRSENIKVPNLDDPQLILKGAGQYAAMCTSCHLQPGVENSELREGMYPQPPNLSKMHVDPQDAFWVIKHGIKMSAMPAWGGSHDDQTIWSMVAFIEKLPGMTPQQYKDIVAKAPPDEDMDMDEGDSHSHHHGDTDARQNQHDSASAPDMSMSASMTGMNMGNAASNAELKPGGSPQAEVAAQAFQDALANGGREAALALLADDARISEDGSSQSRAEYASHHLGKDIAFLKNAQVKRLSRVSAESGDRAQVVTENEILATAKGKPVTVGSHEAMQLKRINGAWKIIAIDWQTKSEAK
ncbi:cytochrome c [Dyella sp.]|uniref:c-type cytochrome n=1 Tax=Dyella sp. TaxID=1869338 RepID=UPI002D1046B3|nr:cytochrome c [Rhodanobacteraceae bacterium]